MGTMKWGSTSIHKINGDKGLSVFKGRLFSLLNRINNLFPYAGLDSGMELQNFLCPDVGAYWPLLDKQSSPSRKLSDLFWVSLPWGNMREELGDIHIMDTGCGSGNYGRKLLQWSRAAVASYTGIDIFSSSNWAELMKQYPAVRFYQADVTDLGRYISPETNLFISQSAIEHMACDLYYFKQIRDFIRSGKKSVMQAHLFPSSACRTLYGYHGIRQYTPRTVSKIVKLFKEFSCSVLFGLGGDNCNRLHYEFITGPRRSGKGDMREHNPDEYDKRLLTAIKNDMGSTQKKPAFYALVIHSNGRNKLF